MKKVVIVGAGPGGLFAANELAGKYDITLIDKGEDVEKRDRCNVCYGMGGAGLYSDGKIIYHTRVGTSLPQIIGKEKVKDLNQDVEKVFKSYGIEVKVLNTEEQKRLDQFKEKTIQAGLDFVYTRTAHVGTDELVNLISDYRDKLKEHGIQFAMGENVNQIRNNVVITPNNQYPFDYLILAPGRAGSSWLEKIVKEDFNFEFGKDYIYNPTDIGVRVEVRREITDKVTDLTRDMKFYMKAGRSKQRDIRTFCTCPGGIVAIEKHEEGFKLVNGHSESGDKGENTNFALLVTIPFTEPQANGNEFARYQARLVANLTENEVLLQRLGDFKQGRRSKTKNINSWFTQPSLKEAVAGDIALHMPYVYFDTILDGLNQLNTVMPGIANDHTLLYSPEIKLHGLRLKVDEHLQTKKQNVYVAGDGPGLTRGIVAAAATGILAARGIIKK